MSMNRSNIVQGDIEKTDELMLNEEDPAPEVRKRKTNKPSAGSPEKHGKTSKAALLTLKSDITASSL